MELCEYVIADLLHFSKLILLCDMFFMFRKRATKYAMIILFLELIFISSISIITFENDNDFFVMIVSEISIIILLCVIYREKIVKMIVSCIWITLILSMLDSMSAVLFKISTNLAGLNCDRISNVGVVTISLVFIIIVGKMYRKHCDQGIKTIGIANLCLFTLLAAADFYIVTIIAFISINENQFDHRKLYSIAIILVILGIFLQLGAVILLFMQRNVYKEKKQITEKYLNEQKNHYEYLDKREKETKKFRHDLRNHMQMLSNFARNHQYDDFDKYLETIEMKIESFGNIITVHNGIVDAVINQFYSKAIQNNIKMEVRGRFPEDCAIDAYDLCTIFSNVLSNALEAAIETDEKLVTVECRYTDKNIIVVVTNSFINDGNETTKTRKDDLDYHGYGLENTKDSIEKYHGVFDIETKDNLFILKILFNYIEKRDYENRNNRG